MKAPEYGRAEVGLVEWFRPGEEARVERALEWLRMLGVTHLRTHLSWAEYHAPGGQAWYDWLMPTLGRALDLLPCVHYTPPSLSETGRTSGPPRRLRDYADFIDHVIDRYGAHFGAIELWNEPNNLLDWDWRVDNDWLKFCTMVGDAAHWAQCCGKRVVLGAPCPHDTQWLTLMGERGVLGVVDVVGIHGFPGTWDSEEGVWPGWEALFAETRDAVGKFNPDLALWVTETGYSTWRHDPYLQVRRFVDAVTGSAERVYWYGLQDLPADVPVQEGLQFDPRHYRFGLLAENEQPKLLARLWRQGGLDAALAASHEVAAPAIARVRPVVVTGGAGFVGSNLAARLAREGRHVLVYDALAREGVERNLDWLRSEYPQHISVVVGDVRDEPGIGEAAAQADAVFHLAGQVAVTSSMENPRDDFDVNVGGTINLLEALRRQPSPPPIVFASTNKVYGTLADIELESGAQRYVPRNERIHRYGIGEDWPLDFHTPYGCSKGAAEQYVLDYARSFGVPTAVLRMSCVYGPRQMGTEDQGWVAHFLLAALYGRTVTIFGDGRQVRDVLYVDDAVEAYLAAERRIGRIAGRAYNLGGGPGNSVSLRQTIDAIEGLTGRTVRHEFADWRPGDQRYFVADTRRARADLGLDEPRPWHSGLSALADWMVAEHNVAGEARLNVGAEKRRRAGWRARTS